MDNIMNQSNGQASAESDLHKSGNRQMGFHNDSENIVKENNGKERAEDDLPKEGFLEYVLNYLRLKHHKGNTPNQL